MKYNNIEEFDWHDCPLYSIRFDDNLELDIDYILRWEIQSDSTYKYFIAPANLIFYNVTNIEISIVASFLNGFEIDRIVKEENCWKIELQEGYIKFDSSGFNQILIKDPIWKENQYLSEEERIVI
ncbi:MAG: hypothetical protein WBP33_08015 [Saprospiraceae bacterium]|nr:hypothetical protein [Candidatus Vicinibacter proximus]MCC6842682.1 hypothetical protein [Saprospiraceae bacterium]HRG34599.1 hypothetical protein [Saprospiraceae bacterium]